MKKKIIFIIIYLIVCSSNGHSAGNSFTNSKIVCSSSACVILQTTNEKGEVIFSVISSILTSLLPEAANYICLKIAGEDNQDICNAIEDGLNFILTAVDATKSAVKLIRNGVEFFAERGTLNSLLNFTSSSLELALNIKSTLEAYKKLGIVAWEISGNYYYEAQKFAGLVTIKNVTETPFHLSLSKDGVVWKEKYLAPGDSKEFAIYTELDEQQQYGFCKGSGLCNYQIFTGKTYKLRYNKLLKQFYLQAL